METLLAAMLLFCAPQDSSGLIMRRDSSMRSVYRVEATLMGAIQATRYADKPTLVSAGTLFPGTSFGGRLMWHPDHLLSVGLYSGYVTFSREHLSLTDEKGSPQDVTLDLTGIPVQVVVAMQPGNFQFGVGLGVYFLTSHTSVNNTERFSSSDYTYGATTWLAYDVRLTSFLTVGPEIGVHLLSHTGLTTGMVGLRVKVDLLTY